MVDDERELEVDELDDAGPGYGGRPVSTALPPAPIELDVVVAPAACPALPVTVVDELEVDELDDVDAEYGGRPVSTALPPAPIEPDVVVAPAACPAFPVAVEEALLDVLEDSGPG